jgi:hypothetical protein
MNKQEAGILLDAELDRFRSMPYDELIGTIGGEIFTCERTAPSGETYQIEIETCWENQKKRVRVLGRIDESPHKPVCWKLPILRWIPIYISAVTRTFCREENGMGA